VVLPSPNGGNLSAHTGLHPTFTACLRNANAVALAASQLGKSIAVIAAGEAWEGGGLRVAVEDLLGAGAIISMLNGSVSPEAAAARATFDALKGRLEPALLECASGRELIGRGHAGDIVLAAPLNVSACIPILQDGAYVNGGGK
jgi:2-phosphosulfolactate phosphatase